MIYPRIRFGVSVQIKTKREPEISFYFIKVNFCRDLDRKMRAELVGPNVDKKRVYIYELGAIFRPNFSVLGRRKPTKLF